MYGRLQRFVPAPAARLLAALWYAGLILAVLFFAFEPAADFRYLRL